MPHPARAAALATAILLAACSTPPAPTVDPHGGHVAGSGAPGTPHPSAPEGADGTVELEDDFATGGSEVSVAEALEVASSRPVLVIGVLLRDAEGGIWFCDQLADTNQPDCGRPRVWLTNVADGMAVFDPEHAADTGAQTADGVTWIPNQYVFGVFHPAP